MCKCTVFKEILVVYGQVVLVQDSGRREEGDGGGRSEHFV